MLQHGGAADGPAACRLLGVGEGGAVGPVVERIAVQQRGAQVRDAAVGAVREVIVEEDVELRRQPAAPDGLGAGGVDAVGDVLGGGPAGPGVEVVPREFPVRDRSPGPRLAGGGIDLTGEVVPQHVGEAEVVAWVGRGVGERDVLLVGVDDPLVDRLLALEADDGAHLRQLQSELTVIAFCLVADEDAAVALRVVQQGQPQREAIAADVVVELSLLGAVLVDAPRRAALVAAELGAFGDRVDRAAGAAGPVQESLRAAHHVRALDVEGRRDAGSGGAEVVGRTGRGETVAVHGAAAGPADTDGLVAHPVAGLLRKSVGVGVRHHRAGAGPVAVEHLLDGGRADVAHKILREDVGRDRRAVQRGVELRERVGVEGAVAVVGLGLHLERVQRDGRPLRRGLGGRARRNDLGGRGGGQNYGGEPCGGMAHGTKG